MIGASGIVGNFHLATNDPEHDFGALELQLAEALGGVIAVTIERIWDRAAVEQERDELLCALDLTGTAVAMSGPEALELRLNSAAQHLLAEVIDPEEHLHRLLVRPPGNPNEGFSRRLEVELTTGESGVLHARSSPSRQRDGTLVTVLELHREQPNISLGVLRALTPREAEVARLVAAGLADREIAEELCLSRHTVSQYVKNIYRKLDTDSRVGLTRLLLTR
jgi:DNA-binding CsgD family transcriptional regulator